MSFIEKLKGNSFVYSLAILLEHLGKTVFFSKALANRNKKNSERDLRTDLTIRRHALEKGMSIGDVRMGFGIPKALSLISDLQLFIDRGGSKDFAAETCSVLYKYTLFNKRGG